MQAAPEEKIERITPGVELRAHDEVGEKKRNEERDGSLVGQLRREVCRAEALLRAEAYVGSKDPLFPHLRCNNALEREGRRRIRLEVDINVRGIEPVGARKLQRSLAENKAAELAHLHGGILGGGIYRAC